MVHRDCEQRGQTVWEKDWRRIRGGMIGYALLGLEQLVAVEPNASQVNLTGAGARVYGTFLARVVGR